MAIAPRAIIEKTPVHNRTMMMPEPASSIFTLLKELTGTTVRQAPSHYRKQERGMTSFASRTTRRHSLRHNNSRMAEAARLRIFLRSPEDRR
jgi:hypothetical protein